MSENYGRGTILVAEDEPGVRKLITHILKEAGFLVLEAKDGMEARKILEDHPGCIDLVLTDIVMPHAGGVKVLDFVISQNHKGPKILFMSGWVEEYTDHEEMRRIIASYPFIRKPFMVVDLLTKISEILGKKTCKDPPQP